MSKLTPVTFKQSWRGYSAGETAGFDADTAQRLIDGKVAVPHGRQAAAGKSKPTKAAEPGTVTEPEAPDPADDEKP